MARQYSEDIPDYAHVMTVKEWLDSVRTGCFIPYDGDGNWVKDGKESQDGVWTTQPEDATHVAWYNK